MTRCQYQIRAHGQSKRHQPSYIPCHGRRKMALGITTTKTMGLSSWLWPFLKSGEVADVGGEHVYSIKFGFGVAEVSSNSEHQFA